jgi:hypothetical protein
MPWPLPEEGRGRVWLKVRNPAQHMHVRALIEKTESAIQPTTGAGFDSKRSHDPTFIVLTWQRRHSLALYDLSCVLRPAFL